MLRFSHCDPAGIGFYPRYVELINLDAEAFGKPIGDGTTNIMKMSSRYPA
jgi:4-hydroxybenzoyl-CoA thioesterase